ncbi:aminopeptidase P family protein [Microbacter margulisiae]|uniref:Xaa-Pro aminopeptidase n=1 Tax=Microbacter margulisiae TaxID=1350067 RepID=A0A7W5H2Y2_9PORP|nr:aminopeptidase P family protein [Microbacter margulisiae]MBB3188255.1 Xaa-Pro aminopeptidase [Microbacter margulisiae]
MSEIVGRLSALRQLMREKGISATIIPSTDPHASEYVSDYWKERAWISGFTGSAGTVVVTQEEAGLWTDSRYFLQAEQQLVGSEITLFKDGVLTTPSISTWLAQVLKPQSKVSINPLLFSVSMVESLRNQLTDNGLTLLTQYDLIVRLWENRPVLPIDAISLYPNQYSGKSTQEKLAVIRKEMEKQKADHYLITALDEIAWLFNIRGKDVEYNPVAIAYAAIDAKTATLFVNPQKISLNVADTLSDEGVKVEPYNAVFEYVNHLHVGEKIWIDKAKTNYALFQEIPAHCQIIVAQSPAFYLKSIKNEIELNGTREAMIKDGVALIRFFMWLEQEVHSGELSELSIADRLRNFRAEQSLFQGESFGTIAGYQEHGAIVHYSASEKTNATLRPEGFLLLDSGAQYLDGTTDITRTVALGALSEQQQKDFTLVLKGHIALAKAKFPASTRGSQLDILARKALWDLGMNYGHGTGHGVGHYLSVHEGPQSIRMDENPTTLVPGMVISNEPGLYRAGQYGIRTENLVTVVEGETTEFGVFYQFETLTLCPIDIKAIDLALLTDEEKIWLNEYHWKVFSNLSPRLSQSEQEWLRLKCNPV